MLLEQNQSQMTITIIAASCAVMLLLCGWGCSALHRSRVLRAHKRELDHERLRYCANDARACAQVLEGDLTFNIFLSHVRRSCFEPGDMPPYSPIDTRRRCDGGS